jgi:hypothetical protein
LQMIEQKRQGGTPNQSAAAETPPVRRLEVLP